MYNALVIVYLVLALAHHKYMKFATMTKQWIRVTRDDHLMRQIYLSYEKYLYALLQELHDFSLDGIEG